MKQSRNQKSAYTKMLSRTGCLLLALVIMFAVMPANIMQVQARNEATTTAPSRNAPFGDVVVRGNVPRVAGWNRLAAGHTYRISIENRADGRTVAWSEHYYFIVGSAPTPQPTPSPTPPPQPTPQLPVITRQPTNQTVNVGQIATFSVVATEATSFQWQFSDDGGRTWLQYGHIPSFQQATMTITATAEMNGRIFRVLVRNNAGTTASQSATITLNMPTPPPPQPPPSQPPREPQIIRTTEIGDWQALSLWLLRRLRQYAIM